MQRRDWAGTVLIAVLAIFGGTLLGKHPGLGVLLLAVAAVAGLVLVRDVVAQHRPTPVPITHTVSFTQDAYLVAEYEAWATEPTPEGVRLTLRRVIDEKPLPVGNWSCRVSFDGAAAEWRGAISGGTRIETVTYPGDFSEAPTLPLHDGPYHVRWSQATADGVGWEPRREIIFNRVAGKLVFP